MMILEPIHTSRLVLRAESAHDTDAIHAMNSDPDVMRYIGNGQAWTSPVEQFRDQHRAALERIRTQPYGSAAVQLRASGQFIGLCWLVPDPLLKEDLELGYRYVRSAWGQGYATEAATAVLGHAFAHLGLRRVVAAVHPDHRASQRVLAKLRFQHICDVFHPRVGRYVHFCARQHIAAPNFG